RPLIITLKHPARNPLNPPPSEIRFESPPRKYAARRSAGALAHIRREPLNPRTRSLPPAAVGGRTTSLTLRANFAPAAGASCRALIV
ncbi:MAG TPA: hypothetical protein VGB61_10650, partial [Pyrinomonadaceae bacterium]